MLGSVFANAQRPGDFMDRPLFEIPEKDGLAIHRRKFQHGIIKLAGKLLPEQRIGWIRRIDSARSEQRGALFVPSATLLHFKGIGGGVANSSEKPGGERSGFAGGLGTFGENHKHRLCDVLSQCPVRHAAEGCGVNQIEITMRQFIKGLRIASAGETIEQILIGWRGHLKGECTAGVEG